MHTGQYVFAQITLFLPQRQFRRIVSKYRDRTEGWGFSRWSHLLVLMFGQLIGCGSLRELTDITTAHAKRSYNLGFGATPVVRNTLGSSLLVKDDLLELFNRRQDDMGDTGQLELIFKC